MNQTVVLKVKDMGLLLEFMNRFLNLDIGLLIEVTSTNVQVKAGTEKDRNMIKHTCIPFDDVFEVASGVLPDLLKVGVFSLPKAISLLKTHFAKGDVTITLQYGTWKGQLTCTNFIIHGNRLKVKVPVTGWDGFLQISDDIVSRQTDISAANFSFALTREDGKRLRALAEQYKTEGLYINCDGSTVNMGTKDNKEIVFQFEYTPLVTGKSGNMIIQNKKLAFIDDEDYTVHVGDEIVVFVSQSSTTHVAIGAPPEDSGVTDDIEEDEIFDDIM